LTSLPRGPAAVRGVGEFRDRKMLRLR